MFVPLAARFWCPLCDTAFRRSEHLERHILSHGSERPFQCLFCQQGFKRRDALKRHWRACKMRLQQDQEIPRLASKTKGKKRKACDRCVRLKKACSLGCPCDGCREKDGVCSIDGVVQGTGTNDDGGAAVGAWKGDGKTGSGPEPGDTPPNGEQADNDNYLVQQLDPRYWLDLLRAENGTWDMPNLWPLGLGDDGRVHPALGIQPLLSAGADLEGFAQPTLNFRQPAPEFAHFIEDFCHIAPDLAQSQSAFVQGPPDFDQSTLGKFPFLSNFTKASGFVDSFECGTLVERQIIAKDFRDRHPRRTSSVAHTNRNNDPEWDSVSLNPTILLSTQPQRPLQPVHSPRSVPYFQSSVEISHGADENDMFRSLWAADELAPKTYEILESIKNITCSKPRGNTIAINWSPLLERMCLEFFSPQNIRKHLAMFWSCWYPNCPIIHRPTFDASRVSHMLLASMVLLGACLSPDNLDCAGAKIWFNSLEESIFSCEQFYDKLDMNATNPSLETLAAQQGLQLLQAAFFISLVQNWEGSQESKRRIRRHRYSAVIAVSLHTLRASELPPPFHLQIAKAMASRPNKYVRDFGISKATLKNVSASDVCTFRWGTFIIHESLVRTFIYVFLFDSAFVVFNNSPPRMVVPELTMDLACPESCFQASSLEECFVHLNSWNSARNSQQRPSLSSTIKIMCRAQISVEHESLFCSLSTLNMFAIATAIHCLAFQIKASLVSTSAISPIHAGIANWKQFWLANTREELINQSFDLPRTMWRRVGFIRHAPEYWLLVKVSLQTLRLSQEYLDADEAFPPAQEVDSHTGLPTIYDNADMSQVNALITTLQGFELSL